MQLPSRILILSKIACNRPSSILLYASITNFIIKGFFSIMVTSLLREAKIAASLANPPVQSRTLELFFFIILRKG